MELLEGQTLGAFLVAHAQCPWPQAALILTQVAAALDAAHDNQVVHRDLKPDNIFITQRAQVPGEAPSLSVKLLDFGIARMADSPRGDTESGALLGTPAYMSPEQCRGAPVDRRTDVYALGVVAFQMLTGELPFSGKNALQFISQQMNDRPPPATRLNPKLPSAVNAVFARLLAKLPAQRPDRASDAVAELLRALDVPEPGRGRPATQAPARGRNWRAWLLAVGAAGLLGALGLALRPRPSQVRVAAVQASGLTEVTSGRAALPPAVSALAPGPRDTPLADSAELRPRSVVPARKPVATKRHDNHELEY
jgi:serine/threonine-protein kinase